MNENARIYIYIYNFIDLSLEDKKEIFEYRNSEEISKWMVNKKITFEEHLKFIDNLVNSDNKYFLVKYNNENIGVISFIVFNEKCNEREVGLYLNPCHIGKDYGKILMDAINIKARELNIDTIMCKTFKKNFRMQKFCKKYNFFEINEDDEFIYYELKIKQEEDK